MPIAPIAPWIAQQFFDADGNPLAGGLIYTYEAGTTTPLATYSSVDVPDPGAARTNPIVLGDDGRPEDGLAIYILPQMYKFAVHNVDDDLLYTVDDVGDRGYINTEYAGAQQTEGGDTEHTGTYNMVATDRMIRFDTSGGAGTLNLLAAADYSKVLVVKNMGTANTVAVTPDGSDTIEGVAAAFTIPVSPGSPNFPTLMLVPNDDGDGWWIVASHRMS